MAVAGNKGGAGGAKNIARAQRRPKAAAPGPPNFPSYVPPRPGALKSQQGPAARRPRSGPPAAPSPAAREQHVRLAAAHTRYAKQATETRKVRQQITALATKPAPGAPNFPTYVPPKPGAIEPKQRPLAFVDTLDKSGKRFVADDSQVRAQHQAEVNYHLAGLFTKGRHVTDQAKSVERLRQLGVAPGTSEFQKAADRFQREQAAKIPKPKRKQGPGGLLGTALAPVGVADKLLSGKLTTGAVSLAEKGAEKGYPLLGRLARGPTGFIGDKIVKKTTGLDVGGAFDSAYKAIGRDIVDLPANVVPSLYVPTKQLATGHPKQAAHTFGDPIVQTFEHPLKSAKEHPVGTALIFEGARGAAGRIAGAAARRGVAGEAGKAYASRSGPARTVPGVAAEVPHTYSRDLMVNRAQKGLAKRRDRLAAQGKKSRPGRGPARSSTQMTEAEMQREVQREHQVVGHVAQRRAAEVEKRVFKATKGASAHDTLAAQGVVHSTLESLQTYRAHLAHLVDPHNPDHLVGKALAEAQGHIKNIDKAVKSHDPERIRHVQTETSKIGKELDDQLVFHGVLTASEAEAARLSGPAFTDAGASSAKRDELGISPKGKIKKTGTLADEQKAVEQARSQAKDARDRAQSNVRTHVSRARISMARAKTSPTLKVLAKAETEAARNVERAQREQKANVAASAGRLNRAQHAAGIAAAQGRRTPELILAESELNAANREVNALRGQQTTRARASGRAEGAAKARFPRINQAPAEALAEAQDAVRRAEADHASRVETERNARAVHSKLGKRATPQQLKTAGRQLSRVTRHRVEAKARLDNARARVTNLQRTAGHISEIERTGAAETHTSTAMNRALARVKAAQERVKAEQKRTTGVPPEHADALRQAIAAHDDTIAAAREGASVRLARAQRDATAAAAKAERGRLSGVEPKVAQDLRNALNERDNAVQAHQQTLQDKAQAKAGRAAHRASIYTTAQGEPLTGADIRAARPPGSPEPYFVSHSTKRGRVSPVTTSRPTVPVTEARSGATIEQGRAPTDPIALAERAVRSSRLATVAEHRNRFIDQWSWRKEGDTAKDPWTSKKEANANDKAQALEKTTGYEWKSIADSEGRYRVIPKAIHDHMAAYERNTGNVHPLIEKYGRRWRQIVLAFSSRWLAGQAIEAAVRTVIRHGGNPFAIASSSVTATKTLRALDRRALAGDTEAATAAERLRAGVGGGGLYPTSENSQRLVGESTGEFAAWSQRFWQHPVPKNLNRVYQAYMKFVMHHVNGRIETGSRMALLGKELRDHPIMDDKIAKVSGQAIEDAANHLTNTQAQNEMLHLVDEAYGKYSGFGPHTKAFVEGYTPFIPWFVNALNFLYHVMPRDHPVMTSLIAAANQGTEEWRRKHGMIFDPTGATPGQAPIWLQGSIPGSGDSYLRLSHYMPFGAGSATADLAGMVVPQYQDMMHAMSGEDWTGKKLTKTGDPSLMRMALAAASGALISQIPAGQQILNISGAHTPDMPDTTKAKGTVKSRARKASPLGIFDYSTAPSGTGGRKAAGGITLPQVQAPKIELPKITVPG